jgi:tetratricopeptide (TPR) repeat protein
MHKTTALINQYSKYMTIKHPLLYLLTILSLTVSAQQQSTDLRETAMAFQRQGDYANTLLVLGNALKQDPGNMELLTDVAYTYFLQMDYGKAMGTIKPLLDRDDAEVRTFQVGGNIYKALQDVSGCEKMYKKAIKKYPASGALYCEYGELLLSMKEPAKAFSMWEKGILSDPLHSGNYYHLSKYHFFRDDRVWSIVMAETFLNLESYSTRSAEIKGQLLESYKNFFIGDPAAATTGKRKSVPFEDAFRQTLAKQAPIVSRGVDLERLIMVRTRFILDWYEGQGKNFPHRMIEQQQYLLREGMYEAYNQWLFGAASNILAYQNWTKLHAPEMNEFSRFQKNRIFRMPPGQYYGSGE